MKRHLRKPTLILSGMLALACNGKVASAEPAAALNPSVIAPAEKLSQAFVAVAKQVKPAVVSVYSEKVAKYRSSDIPLPYGDDFLQKFFGGAPFQGERGPRGHFREFGVPMKGMGSGMILDRKGTVLTNFHVVNGFDQIKIQLADGTEFPAKVKGSDARSDVAILQIACSVPSDLPVIALGDSDQVEVGELVLAVGAPFGLPQTVTQGMISAKGRANVGVADIEDFLQTDTPINPGNSGGPLVNMRGEVVGINSAIATSVGQFSGVGFSIPINMVKAMLPQLEKGESISRGQLGVAIQDLSSELAKQFGLKRREGALVASVAAGSAAEKAGIKEGDVIASFDGKPVMDSAHLRNLVAGTAPGTSVRVGLTREGTTMDFKAVIQKTEPESVEGVRAAESVQDLGLEVQDLTPEARRQLGAKSGVVVIGVLPGSAAAIAGIQQNDVVVEMDRKPVKSARDFRRNLQGVAKKGPVLLLVYRQGAKLFVVIQANDGPGQE